MPANRSMNLGPANPSAKRALWVRQLASLQFEAVRRLKLALRGAMMILWSRLIRLASRELQAIPAYLGCDEVMARGLLLALLQGRLQTRSGPGAETRSLEESELGG